VLVVGHTDAVGAFDFNLDLSRRCAEAVVVALTSSRYGIEARRLSPHGVAYLSPVDTNRTEQGRSKNRRVELDEQQ
jgi:outer membrane protein OmpA-like peptidoglycan-associated protein